MELVILILLIVILFLLVIAAMLAGAVGIAFVLRWVWPAIDPGSATIAGLIALLVTAYLTGRVISLVSREEVELDEDNDDDDDDDDLTVRGRQVLWKVQPAKGISGQRRRRRRQRG